jgi:type I restriction enzyme R subunit
VRPLECVFFMRSVKSRTYFEQMKGRGVRVINEADFQAITPDARAKSRFVIVDAVGVTETDLADTQPLERLPTIPLERLLKQVAFGNRDPDAISSIAGRIARLDRQLTQADRDELEELAGMPLHELTGELVAALDPDRHLASAQQKSGVDEPSAEQIAAAEKQLIEAAVEPLATNPKLRERLVEIRRSYEQTIDEFSRDEVIAAGYSIDSADRARQTVDSFREFIEQHKDEITALQILYSRPYHQRPTFKEIKELANAIGRPPYQWTPESLWAAYEALDRSKVRGSGGHVLTDIVSLVRFALEQENELVPYPERVTEQFRAWLLQQDNAGRRFTPEQLAWLDRIRDHVAAALAITTDDFDYTPFVEQGGIGKAHEVFGDDLVPMLGELNEALAA